MSTSSHSGDCAAVSSNSNSTIILSAIGVVFGDIGTSPLYTLKEAFSPNYGLAPNHDTVLGILSLIFWAMMLVVTIKYVIVIMRVDNDGEGGIMALTALTQRTCHLVAVRSILWVFWASLVLHCSLAMGSLLRRSRCCQQLKVWKWLSLI